MKLCAGFPISLLFDKKADERGAHKGRSDDDHRTRAPEQANEKRYDAGRAHQRGQTANGL